MQENKSMALMLYKSPMDYIQEIIEKISQQDSTNENSDEPQTLALEGDPDIKLTSSLENAVGKLNAIPIDVLEENMTSFSQDLHEMKNNIQLISESIDRITTHMVQIKQIYESVIDIILENVPEVDLLALDDEHLLEQDAICQMEDFKDLLAECRADLQMDDRAYLNMEFPTEPQMVDNKDLQLQQSEDLHLQDHTVLNVEHHTDSQAEEHVQHDLQELAVEDYKNLKGRYNEYIKARDNKNMKVVDNKDLPDDEDQD